MVGRDTDALEAEFSKRFPPALTLAEQAESVANEKGIENVLVLSPEDVAQIVVAHVASTLEDGQHIEFALAKEAVYMGLGTSAQSVAMGVEHGGDVLAMHSPTDGDPSAA